MSLGLRMDEDHYLDTVALLSNRSWSVYIDSFWDANRLTHIMYACCEQLACDERDPCDQQHQETGKWRD
jgi:hypothetical protein